MVDTKARHGVSHVILYPDDHALCADDLDSLVTSCYEQKRVVDNAPCEVTSDDIRKMYKDNMRLW